MCGNAHFVTAITGHAARARDQGTIGLRMAAKREVRADHGFNRQTGC
jgi:hypothetical protein